MIFSFISSYHFSTIFLKTNSSWLITDSVNTLEVKPSMLFILEFANDAILPCFFFFFLVTNLLILIPAIIAQIFSPVA